MNEDFVFNNEKIVDQLKHGINPMPGRIVQKVAQTSVLYMFMYFDKETQEKYYFIPSIVTGESEYSFEKVITVNNDVLTRRTNKKIGSVMFRLNGVSISKNEFKILFHNRAISHQTKKLLKI